MPYQPPKRALQFLRWYCREDYLDEIEGDLLEIFELRFQENPKKAIRSFWWQVLLHFRPDYFKPILKKYSLTNRIMWRHNILISYRSLLRNKTSFFINLFGLSTGLTCVFLILLWVNDELNVDTFHEKDENLYQAMVNYQHSNEIETWEDSPGPLAKALVAEISEVIEATTVNQKMFTPEGVLIDDETTLEVKGLFASENFFDVLTYPLIQGESQYVLNKKENIVLSESTARKLYGSTTDAMGKELRWKNRFFDKTFEVTGVYADSPKNATKQFDAVIHYQLLVDWDKYAYEWGGTYAETFVVTQSGTDINFLNEKLTKYLRKTQGWEPSTLFFQKFSDRYLHGTYEEGILVGGRIFYVKLFSFIAAFILLIACINFINLSTAQASRKMKEIGVKKTIGAHRVLLIQQFLSESVIVAFASFILAICFLMLLLPEFNTITGKSLAFYNPLLMLALVGVTLFTGLLAGSYPAFFLSGFQPLKVLKGKLSNADFKGVWVRKSLVVFQFVLSMIFIVGIIVIQKQIEYTQQKNLGFQREQVLTVERPEYRRDSQALVDELKKIPGVAMASNMDWSILSGRDSQGGYAWTSDDAEKEIDFKAPRVGYGVLETLGMELIQGRSFSREYNDDHTKIILNESALKLMQLEDPIGKVIRKGSDNNREIIGVVKDFHYGSIHQKIEPLIFRFREHGRNVLMKIETSATQNTLSQVEDVFKKFHPEYPFQYSFLDDDYEALYQAESKIALITKYFGALAIIISCLGLLGLTIFSTERRMKEIGIRKVFGSGRLSIVRLLSSDFTKVVIVAILISFPLSYWLVTTWLESFAYRVAIEWWFFGISAGLVLLVAWLTISLQTLKAANVNPINCLKDE